MSSKKSEASGLSRRDRREARCRALQLLYSLDQKRFQDDGYLFAEDDEAAPLSVAGTAFAQQLFDGCVSSRSAIDASIDRYLKNWTIHRLAVVDRSLLRLGAYELLFAADIPAKVSINEYVDLAKIYGSDAKTAKLINGVLDSVAKQHRSTEVG